MRLNEDTICKPLLTKDIIHSMKESLLFFWGGGGAGWKWGRGGVRWASIRQGTFIRGKLRIQILLLRKWGIY